MNIPDKKQLDFLDMEVGVFLHYGIRTFNEEHRDWDMKPMEPITFDPSEQDVGSWIKQLKKIGVKYTVLTSKHHDGFALWQTEQSEFCVRNSAYKNGKGDVVKEYVDACHKYGMFCGIYYSCSQFDTESRDGNEYDDYVIAQITELLTGYGKIDYLWFDGCGSEGHKFDADRIIKTFFSLQPDILVHGAWGKNVRWIGNEWGAAPLDNRNELPGFDGFLPGECDCCITRNQWENFWFYNETHRECVRTPEEMPGLYYISVGRGSNLLINIAPDRRGLLPEENLKLLGDMMKEMKRRLVDCRIPSSEVCFDGEKYYISFDKYSLVDHVVLEEDMTDGQHINGFDVCISETCNQDVNVLMFRGGTVGHKMICTFPPVRAKNIVVRITDSDGQEKLKSIYACYASGGENIKQIY